LVVEKLQEEEINCMPVTVQLLPDYNTAKLMYKALKLRATTRACTTTEGGRMACIPSKPNIVGPCMSKQSIELASVPQRWTSI
jgi:hypothetical protein